MSVFPSYKAAAWRLCCLPREADVPPPPFPARQGPSWLPGAGDPHGSLAGPSPCLWDGALPSSPSSLTPKGRCPQRGREPLQEGNGGPERGQELLREGDGGPESGQDLLCEGDGGPERDQEPLHESDSGPERDKELLREGGGGPERVRELLHEGDGGPEGGQEPFHEDNSLCGMWPLPLRPGSVSQPPPLGQ